jgi:hypothetical protein
MRRHRPGRPTRGIRWGGLQCRGDQRLDPIIADYAGPSWPRHFQQTRYALGGESVAPFGHHSPRHSQLLSYLGITRICVAGKDDP